MLVFFAPQMFRSHYRTGLAIIVADCMNVVTGSIPASIIIAEAYITCTWKLTDLDRTLTFATEVQYIADQVECV